MPHEVRPGRRDGPPPTRVFPPLPTDVGTLPALDPAFSAALDAGLGQLQLDLTSAARAAIEAHVRLLLAWNAAINLTAITDPAQVALRHVLDSLAAVPLLLDGSRERGGHGLRIVDLGSGGGFPGMPLSAALPHAHMTLVEAVAKKARFMGAAVIAADLGPRVAVVRARAEQLDRRDCWDVAVARAVGTLPDLVELAMPRLRVGGRLIAWKGSDIDAEVAAGTRASAALGGGAPAVHPVTVDGLEGHHLVTIEKRFPTPAGYPRDPAARRARPW